MKKNIEQIAKEDGRYDPSALKFVYDGLGYTIQSLKKSGKQSDSNHISGAELANGIAQLAVKRWGRMAKTVLNHWGVTTTRDMGDIVYLMITNEWMTAQETDTVEDFNNIYDFEELFEKNFTFKED